MSISVNPNYSKSKERSASHLIPQLSPECAHARVEIPKYLGHAVDHQAGYRAGETERGAYREGAPT